jgi:transcriptional regulator with XRE-family HTH domain
MYQRHDTDGPNLWVHTFVGTHRARISARGRKRPPVPEVRSPAPRPTLRRRELGAVLRARRLGLGLTVEQVAEGLLCSPSKVSRMETGQRGATQRDVRDLCALYGITEQAERDRLMALAREGKQQHSFGPPNLAFFYELEQEAVAMQVYHSAVVPGLFQTGDYARALHLAAAPPIEHEDIEQRVDERVTRQQLLDSSDSPRIEVVLDEAVLHRPIGGAAVMREQLGRLLDASRRPNVKLRVVPFAIGAHPALESDFIILNSVGQTPSVVYVEGLVGPTYVERDEDVQRYQHVFERLRAIGLSPKDSADLITKIRDTYPAG